MHILILEDERKILSYLVEGLRAEGHTTQGCPSYEEAKEFIESGLEGPFDVVILDRMLGDRDGADLIPVIRKKMSLCAVVVLSAIGNAEEKAEILDRGADDYVPKPFSLVELSARLRVVERRAHHSPSRHLNFKNCEIDLVDHCVKVKGQRLELSQKEYQLLLVFLKHPGRVHNRFQLLDRVWNTQHDIESNVVEVTINNIRRKLESSGCEFGISSKRNVGYWVEN